MPDPDLLWFRRDLRLADQPALAAAIAEGPVVPVFVLDDDVAGQWRMGGASRWWLHHSLASLDKDLRARGSRLVLRRGDCAEELTKVAKAVGAQAVHAISHYEPWWRAAEDAVAKQLDLILHDGNYLASPGSIMTGSGTPYKIYTPFRRALDGVMPPPHPHNRPRAIPAPTTWPASDVLADWDLLPTKPDWSTGFGKEWTPGEAGAHDRLDDFVDAVADYDHTRNLPSVEGSSRLSPHLHFGEVSAAQVWHRLAGKGGSVRVFLGELAWRDYAQNVILQLPKYGAKNGRDRFDKLPWRTGKAAKADFRAWQRGLTGYPIVDAGMRQLWTSGWMHNRVRMIAASFLIKHLLIDWREGERWFWDCLVDGDYGNNSVNWQWVAGTGIDANMWGRIMAPLAQSEKFDAADYIREWVSELRGLSDAAIHDPEASGCKPDAYPAKLIGHREARERALAAGRAVR
ncbi:MAG: deoxyribodipyrimidine photo-lyase [Sphingomonas sp.]|uniref:cryptochrome/photolyase family protein n=1 Tax=Sphingomonas sp. TaxID=28214 RepID=UPI001AC1C04D|nr:deoxyribodipyrimidine photo-lyase [Sphingomonas sp.]MBN8807595.1 deoxyribodipyrimidine photo-lyase [Sphingomonas sp.]